MLAHNHWHITTSGHCQDTIPLLKWESMTITTDRYCWSLPGYDTTLTVGVYDHYHRLLLLVIATDCILCSYQQSVAMAIDSQ